jgi:hypothetical protein
MSSLLALAAAVAVQTFLHLALMELLAVAVAQAHMLESILAQFHQQVWQLLLLPEQVP